MLLRSRKIEVVSTQSAKTQISNLLRSGFSESAEWIEVKRISFKRYFKAQDSLSINFFFLSLLELSLKKTVKMFIYLISEVLCNIYQVYMTTLRKGDSPDFQQCLDQERSLWKVF